MIRVGRMLFPALRWHAKRGFAHEQNAIDTALALGVGGFCIFGGEADAVRALTTELNARSRHPLLIASDLERGAGQQFTGATQLPPLAALGAIDDLAVTQRAAALTGHEALALGVNWVYAPVADLDIEPLNPIVGTRSFGADPARVAEQVVAWIRACRAEGALCCVKHFPGHGRTTEDSHAVLPSVDVPGHMLDADLTPFRAAMRAGVDAVMTAHVAYPALDPSGTPATRSSAIVGDLLRDELEYDGLVVTDALIMEGAVQGAGGETDVAVAAIAAGCDALLYPKDMAAVATALASEIGRTISEERLVQSSMRIHAAALRATDTRAGDVGRGTDRAWALALGARSCIVVRGSPRVAERADIVTVDDDVGGPYPTPGREVFLAALHSAGSVVHEVERPDRDRPAVVAVYADIRAWKGRPGLSARARDALAAALDAQPEATVVLFGHPRLAHDMPGRHVLAAWGGEAVMQSAAALRLREG